jgi:hypothetical protein
MRGGLRPRSAPAVPPLAFELTSGAGLVVSILVLGALFLAWVVSLFLLVADSISLGAKLLWFLALTCLAPIGIPAYLLARRGRR